MAPQIETNSVGMVRRIRDRNHAALRGKSINERIAFYRARADQLHERLGCPEQRVAEDVPHYPRHGSRPERPA